MTTLICPTCSGEVAEGLRKEHFRSEWHIYNLKRIVANLPPISDSEFVKKQTFFASTAGPSRIPESNKKRYCQYCKKSFNAVKSFENHLASRQHKFNVNSFEGKAVFDERLKAIRLSACENDFKKMNDHNEDGEEGEQNRVPKPLSVGDCLFCDRSFANNVSVDVVARVLRHMSDAHGFVLPHEDKLADAVGLLADLGRLVGVEACCMGCGRQFVGRSTDGSRQEALAAVRAHMRDAQHNFLYTGLVDPVTVALAVAEKDAEGLEDDGMTTTGSGRHRPARATSLPPIARVGGELYSQFYLPERADNTLVLPDDADGDAYEVTLPNGGGVLGHRRHYQTVYRQNLAFSLAVFEAEARGRRFFQASALTTAPCASAVRQQQLVVAARHGAALTSTALTGRRQRVSRVDAHRQTALKDAVDKYHLDLGMRGNYVLRGHLRRQY